MADMSWVKKYLKEQPGSEEGLKSLPKPPTFQELMEAAGGKKNTAAPKSTAGSQSGSSGKGGADYAAAAYQTAAASGTGGVDTSYFDSMLSAYEAALEAQRRARQAAYESAVRTQQGLYDQNVSKVNSAADKALGEAYINRMQSQRTQRQALAAQGLTGGASETSLAGILNGYANARNNIETERMSQISDLGRTLQNNIAQAKNILDNGVAGDYADFLDKTAKLYASNAKELVQAGQGKMGQADGSFYASLVRSLLEGGASAAQAAQVLQAAGLSAGQLEQLFAGQAG